MAEGRGRRVFAAAAIAVAVYLAIEIGRPGSPAVVAAATGGLTIAAALAAAVVWLRSSHWASGRAKVGLWLFALAMFAWAVGNTIRIGTYLVDGDSGATIPPLAEAAFAVTLLLGPPAIALLYGTHRVASVRTLLDAMLIATALLYLIWATMLGPSYRAQAGGGTALVQLLVYPLADTIIASMALILAREAAPAMRVPGTLAATGVILMCASDLAYMYLSAQGTYIPGNVSDLGWFLGLVVVAVSTPRRRELAGWAAATGADSSSLLLPHLPFFLALGTAVTLFAVRHGEVYPTEYVLSTVLTVLVLVRQLIVLSDNQTLTRRLERAVNDLAYRANHDPLTGLANRQMFLDAVGRALAPAAGAQLGVLFIDLDGFKPVNDTLGHAAGDRVLVAVAGRLTRAAREGDLVARLGGDEFAIMLPDLHYAPDAHSVAQRIQAALDVDIDLDGETARVGASVGLAYGRAGRIGLGELLRQADVAMYTAKAQGRRRTVAFEPHLLSRRPLGRVS